MATKKTPYLEWDKPIFPSDNLDGELDSLFDQIDYDVFQMSGLDLLNDSTSIIENPDSINFSNKFVVTNNQDETASVDLSFNRYTDIEASNASPVQSVNGETGDVTVDVGSSTQIISMTTSSGQNINTTTTVDWDEHIIYGDSAFSHSLGNSSVTIEEDGIYKIYANLYSDSNSTRSNPSFRFRVNGNEVPGRSGSAYARNADGHDKTSTSLEIAQELVSGDTIDIYTFREADGGSAYLEDRRSIFTITKLIR